jgi:hypothetical protein
MADTIKVRAVEGRLCPYEGSTRVGHVGWQSAAESEADHVIPGVGAFKRSTDPIDVPNTVYYRLAVACGDLEAVEETPVRNALRRAPSEV